MLSFIPSKSIPVSAIYIIYVVILSCLLCINADQLSSLPSHSEYSMGPLQQIQPTWDVPLPANRDSLLEIVLSYTSSDILSLSITLSWITLSDSDVFCLSETKNTIIPLECNAINGSNTMRCTTSTSLLPKNTSNNVTWGSVLDSIIPCALTQITFSLTNIDNSSIISTHNIGDAITAVLPPKAFIISPRWTYYSDIPQSESIYLATKALDWTLHDPSTDWADSKLYLLWAGWFPPHYYNPIIYVFKTDDESISCSVGGFQRGNNNQMTLASLMFTINNTRNGCSGITENWPIDQNSISFSMTVDFNNVPSVYEAYNDVVPSSNSLIIDSTPLILSITVHHINTLLSFDSLTDDIANSILLPVQNSVILQIETLLPGEYRCDYGMNEYLISDGTNLRPGASYQRSTRQSTYDPVSQRNIMTYDITQYLYLRWFDEFNGNTTPSYTSLDVRWKAYVGNCALQSENKLTTNRYIETTPGVVYANPNTISAIRIELGAHTAPTGQEVDSGAPTQQPLNTTKDILSTISLYITAKRNVGYTIKYKHTFTYYLDTDITNGIDISIEFPNIQRDITGATFSYIYTDYVYTYDLFYAIHDYLNFLHPATVAAPQKRIKHITNWSITPMVYFNGVLEQSTPPIVSNIISGPICAPPYTSDCTHSNQDTCYIIGTIPWDYTSDVADSNDSTYQDSKVCQCQTNWTDTYCDSLYLCTPNTQTVMPSCDTQYTPYTFTNPTTNECTGACGCSSSDICSGNGVAHITADNMACSDIDGNDHTPSRPYTCLCQDGWAGDSCQYPISQICIETAETVLHNCNNNGYIVYTPNTDHANDATVCTMQCQCYDEWTGSTCLQKKACKDKAATLNCGPFGYLSSSSSSIVNNPSDIITLPEISPTSSNNIINSSDSQVDILADNDTQCSSTCQCLFGYTGSLCATCNISCYRGAANPAARCISNLQYIMPCLCSTNALGRYCQYYNVSARITFNNLSLPFWLHIALLQNAASKPIDKDNYDKSMAFIQQITTNLNILFGFSTTTTDATKNILTNTQDIKLIELYHQDSIDRVHMPLSSLSITKYTSCEDSLTGTKVSIASSLAFNISIRVGKSVYTSNKEYNDVISQINQFTENGSLAQAFKSVFASTEYTIPRIGDPDDLSSICAYESTTDEDLDVDVPDTPPETLEEPDSDNTVYSISNHIVLLYISIALILFTIF